ncbi:MAG: hypothetical protein H0X24_07760 [Ktedonobacterales bacterium]|nr:hypothetical protein [Ktedonobacterales bacterium]
MVESSVSRATTAQATPTPRGSKTLAWVMMLVTGVTMAYWMMWFMLPGGRDALAVLPKDVSYLHFENAFPVADGWLSLTALIASIQLFRAQSSALPWLFMAGSAGMYLGGMDILFDIENGIYTLWAQNPGAVSTEMLINIATVAISVVTLLWAWRQRMWLCQP